MSEFLRSRVVRTGLAAIVTLAGAAGCAASREQGTPAPLGSSEASASAPASANARANASASSEVTAQDKLRTALVNRYAGCVVTSVIDRHAAAPEALTTDTPRGLVDIKLKLTDKPNAHKLVQEYTHSHTVQFSSEGAAHAVRPDGTPVANGDKPGGMPRLTVKMQSAKFGGDLDLTPGITLTTRNDYPAGTRLAVFADTMAATVDPAHGETRSEAETYCGTITKTDTPGTPDGSTWALDPTAQPALEGHRQTFTPFDGGQPVVTVP